MAFEVAADLGYAVEERPFSVKEAHAAEEAFISAATTVIMPVVSIDGEKVGSGVPGPVTLALRLKFHDFSEIA